MGQALAETTVTVGATSVLLVDDDPDILDSLKTLLEVALDDVDVRTAPSGESALELLQAQREAVRLIISDFRMSGMDGVEFLRHARVYAPRASRVLISAFPEAVLRERVQQLEGIAKILPKPMDVDEFLDVARTLLAAR